MPLISLSFLYVYDANRQTKISRQTENKQQDRKTTNKQTINKTDKQTTRYSDGQHNKQTIRQTDRQTDRQQNKQANNKTRHTDRPQIKRGNNMTDRCTCLALASNFHLFFCFQNRVEGWEGAEALCPYHLVLKSKKNCQTFVFLPSRIF